MTTLINTFLSYFVLMLIFAAVAGVGVAIGIQMRKKKNAQTPDTAQADQQS
ncbi:MAG: hypothetical protein IJZ34_13875 [Lachnospiraceae bacterium]|nr:hypothetical protein [Lachnospiraceae bacterium]